jgi:hypothetical protein
MPPGLADQPLDRHHRARPGDPRLLCSGDPGRRMPSDLLIVITGLVLVIHAFFAAVSRAGEYPRIKSAR